MAANVSGLKRKAERRYGQAANDAGAAMKAELRVHAPHRSYELRDAIDYRVARVSPSRWRIILVAPVIQAATTNTGARPHIIRPRRAKMLRFYWPKAGTVVFRSIVFHPGNKGTHWWDKVLARHSAILRSALRRQ